MSKFAGIDLPEGQVELKYKRCDNKEAMLNHLDELARLALACLRITNTGDN